MEFNSAFPRLRLAYFHEAASLDFPIDMVDVIVNIYKPTTIDELQAQCRPSIDDWWDMFCVFGINPSFPTSLSEITHDGMAINVTQLIVDEGAGIHPPSDYDSGGQIWNIAPSSVLEDMRKSFRLVLWDNTPALLTNSTMEFVLRFLEFGKEDAIDEWGEEPHLTLERFPSVFASFVSVMRPGADEAHGIHFRYDSSIPLSCRHS